MVPKIRLQSYNTESGQCLQVLILCCHIDLQLITHANDIDHEIPFEKFNPDGPDRHSTMSTIT